MRWTRRRRRTVVYVLRSLTRKTLYVGITSRNPSQRWAEHARDKPWWPEVVFKQVESSHRSVAAAKRRERSLIRRYRPKYNLEHNDLAHVPSWYLRERRRKNQKAQFHRAAIRIPLVVAALWVVSDRGLSGTMTLIEDVVDLVSASLETRGLS